MHPSEKLFAQLAALARRAPQASAPDDLPFGFETRVLAQIRGAQTESPWEFLALRSLPLAAALAAICLLMSLWSQPAPDEAHLAAVIIETQLAP